MCLIYVPPPHFMMMYVACTCANDCQDRCFTESTAFLICGIRHKYPSDMTAGILTERHTAVVFNFWKCNALRQSFLVQPWDDARKHCVRARS